MYNFSCNPGFLRQIVFLLNVSLTSQDSRTLRTFLAGAQKTKEDSRTLITQQKATGWVLFTPIVTKVHVSSIMKQSGELTIIVGWKLTSGRKLNNSDITLFSSRKGLLSRLHALFLLFGMICFSNHGLKSTYQEVGKKDHPTSNH